MHTQPLFAEYHYLNMSTVGRILNMGKNCAGMNMAVDEVILSAQKERPYPTLRFYDWSTSAFSFGYFQDIDTEVDVETCLAENIELVKRMTGGGTVVHGWDLTYSLVLPRHAEEITVSEMYRRIGNSLVNAFKELSIPAECYKTVEPTQTDQNICLTNPAEYDVMCNDKKLAGVSVRRNRKGIMFQGYISLDMIPENILRHVSKIPKNQQTLLDNVTAINTEGRHITRTSLIKAICETFDIGVTFNSDELSIEENRQAQVLADSKYKTTKWNFQ